METFSGSDSISATTQEERKMSTYQINFWLAILPYRFSIIPILIPSNCVLTWINPMQLMNFNALTSHTTVCKWKEASPWITVFTFDCFRQYKLTFHTISDLLALRSKTWNVYFCQEGLKRSIQSKIYSLPYHATLQRNTPDQASVPEIMNHVQLPMHL